MDVVETRSDTRKPAVSYLRVSGATQQDGGGFTRQQLACHKYAMEHRLRIVKEYREVESGTTESENRDVWMELIAHVCKSTPTPVILIERLDRLGRTLMVQEHIVVDLQRRGITLISVAEPDLCSTDESRVLMRQIMGAIAQYDRTLLVKKMLAGKARKQAETGLPCGGMHRYGSHPKHRARERRVIERIRALKQAGESYTRIAATLNQEGIRPRSAKSWHPFQVQRIVQRHAIQGGASSDRTQS